MRDHFNNERYSFIKPTGIKVMIEHSGELDVLLTDHLTGLGVTYQGKADLLCTQESFSISSSMRMINMSGLVIALMRQPFMQMLEQCGLLANPVNTRLSFIDEPPILPGTWVSTETWSYHRKGDNRLGYLSMPGLWRSIRSRIRPPSYAFESAYILAAAVAAGEMFYYMSYDTGIKGHPNRESMKGLFIESSIYGQTLKSNIQTGIQGPAIVPMLTLTPLLLSEKPARGN